MFLERSLWRPLLYSLSGIAHLLRERAFREEWLTGLILWNIALWRLHWCPLQLLLTLSFVTVFITEALNSAIETIIDLISPEEHILAKKAKDIGSAAVFIAITNALTIFVLCLIL
jgi:diacylglycerol kinase (ATP)